MKTKISKIRQTQFEFDSTSFDGLIDFKYDANLFLLSNEFHKLISQTWI